MMLDLEKIKHQFEVKLLINSNSKQIFPKLFIKICLIKVLKMIYKV